MITNTESQVSPFAICIALLPSLCNPQILSHSLYHLLCIFYNVRAKELRLTNLIPIERSPTLSAIQCLEGGLLQTGLVAVVIGELSVRQALIPTSTILNSTSSQHILQHLVGSLCLPIYLRMIGGTEAQLRIQQIMELLPEPRSKLRPSVRYDLLGHTMQADNPRDVQLCKSSTGVDSVHWNE